MIAVTVGTSAVFGQDVSALRSELIAAMKGSFEKTKATPFRTRTKVEMGLTPTTQDWEPYSSGVIETILPDMSHFTFTSGRTGEYVRIGDTSFIRDEKGGWRSHVTKSAWWSISNPAAALGLNGRSFEFYTESSGSNRNVKVYRVVKTQDTGAEDLEKRKITWIFSFDKTGVLFEHESTGYNGRNWVRTTESFEYDPNIKIEAPISN